MSKRLLCALAPVVGALLIAFPAQAKTDHVVGGHVTVTRSAQLTAFLRSRGIKVTPIGAMKLGNGSLTMPMAGGQLHMPGIRIDLHFGDVHAVREGRRHVGGAPCV